MFLLEKIYADEMIAHAREEDPNECCGIIAGSNGRVAKLFRANNSDKSPVRYNVDPKDLLRIDQDLRDNNWDWLGIYHSHTHTQAYPSPTDVSLAFYPDSLYFIISLIDKQNPVIRAFHIVDEQISEEEIKIV